MIERVWAVANRASTCRIHNATDVARTTMSSRVDASGVCSSA